MVPEARQRLLDELLDAVDPRLNVRRALARMGDASPLWPTPSQQVVLVGHRAAGKSRLLPSLGKWLGRPTLELDAEISRRAGRQLHEWVQLDPASFRRAERETFIELPAGRVIAAGGGFLALHPDLLEPHVAVLVPVSYETYRERLLSDRSRPRLRPELSLEGEIAAIFEEREQLHARARVHSLVDFLAATIDPGGGVR
ncbi:MAG TPA: shikimate kinase [Myxococcaceae bacterium]|nr:shikimate kinase [Myxococcaceae bacterium]